MKNDRSDKFTYTSARQIKFGPKKDQAAPLRALRELIEQEGLDASKVLDLVQDHLDDLRR